MNLQLESNFQLLCIIKGVMEARCTQLARRPTSEFIVPGAETIQKRIRRRTRQ